MSATRGLGKAPHVRELIAGADLILAIGLRFGEILTDGYTLFDVPDPRQRADPRPRRATPS